MILIIGGSGEDRNGYAEEHFPGCAVVRDYQRTVKDQLLAGKKPQEEARKLAADAGADTVITTVEAGCGVVPTDAFERTYREENGRVNCILAESADQVIRVLCGIGQRIK